mmetsp:Transcript_11107/g.22130  ORF Transcript_11107/g.22130 Transcript_11107/m.22130 type:complete len:202 (+) Transcript_11107:495-1100(+)
MPAVPDRCLPHGDVKVPRHLVHLHRPGEVAALALLRAVQPLLLSLALRRSQQYLARRPPLLRVCCQELIARVTAVPVFRLSAVAVPAVAWVSRGVHLLGLHLVQHLLQRLHNPPAILIKPLLLEGVAYVYLVVPSDVHSVQMHLGTGQRRKGHINRYIYLLQQALVDLNHRRLHGVSAHEELGQGQEGYEGYSNVRSEGCL